MDDSNPKRSTKFLTQEEIKEYIQPIFNFKDTLQHMKVKAKVVNYASEKEEEEQASEEEEDEEASEKEEDEESEEEDGDEKEKEESSEDTSTNPKPVKYDEKQFFESESFQDLCNALNFKIISKKTHPNLVLKYFLVEKRVRGWRKKKADFRFAFAFERDGISTTGENFYEIVKTEYIHDKYDCNPPNCLWSLEEKLGRFPWVNNSWNPFTHPEKVLEFLDVEKGLIQDGYCDNWSEFYDKTKTLYKRALSYDTVALEFPTLNKKGCDVPLQKWLTWNYLKVYIQAFFHKDFNYDEYSVTVDCDDEAVFAEPFKLNIKSSENQPVENILQPLTIDWPLKLIIKPLLKGGKPKEKKTNKPKKNKSTTSLFELEFKVDVNKYKNRRSEINGVEVEAFIIDLCDEEICAENNYTILETRTFLDLDTFLDDIKVYLVEASTKYNGSGIRQIYYGKKGNSDSIIGADIEVWVKEKK